jgi:excisionase family DNA binding protein
LERTIANEKWRNKVGENAVEREWLSVADVQRVLGIGSTKAYELVQSGELPAIRIGRTLRIHRREIAEWAERNRCH